MLIAARPVGLNAKRIMSMLISARSVANAQNDDAESRVDYIADRLGIERQETFKLIQILREENILANTKDLTAFVLKTDTENKSLNVLKRYAALEQFLIGQLSGEGQCINLKELNESAVSSGVKNATVMHSRQFFIIGQSRNISKRASRTRPQEPSLCRNFLPRRFGNSGSSVSGCLALS